MEFDTALQVFSYRNFNALVAMQDAELLLHVRELLASCEASPEPVNHDKLLATGITIARTQKPGVDVAVIGWMQSEPSARRIDSACALLAGLWHPQFFQGQIDPSELLALAENWNAAATDDDAAASFVFAVFQASKTKTTAEGRLALKGILRSMQDHPPSSRCQRLVQDQLAEIASAVDPR